MSNRTTVERKSEGELAISRTFDAPARVVFEAWTRPELFKRWWAPRSMGATISSCAMDVRSGGGYRIEFGKGDSKPITFFGKYVDVVPDRRLVWTNEESDDGAVTTVTFADEGARTQLIWRERYASKEALDEAIVGMEGMAPEQFAQLDELLMELGEGGSGS